MLRFCFTVVGALLTAQSAFASTTVSTFDFTDSDNFSNRTSGYGNVYEMSQGSLDLDIKAFADTGRHGKVEDAKVSSNGHGLLVYNRDEGSNQHYVDNYQDRDMLLFDFNKSVALTKLNIGYSYNDSDMVVIGFDSLPTFVTFTPFCF